MTLAIARALRELALIACVLFLFVGATLWRIDESVYAYEWLLSGAGYLATVLMAMALGDYFHEAFRWSIRQWRLS